jgi:Ca2+-binding RTX toxin-like protein
LDYVSAQPSEASDSCEPVNQYFFAEPARDASFYWGYGQIRCELGSLDTGETESVDLTATRNSEFEMSVGSYVETASYDGNYDNDYAFVDLDGEPYAPCGPSPEGSKQSDDISVIDCPVEAGAGADNVLVRATPSSKDVDVSAGKGPDSLVVDVPSGSNKARKLKVNSGPGRDNVTIVVAPGATNATVVVRTGKGRDYVTIDASRLAPGIRIVVIGGRGADIIEPSPSTSAVDATWLKGFVLWGGLGNDTLTGAYADDSLHGGDGRDVITGGSGADSLDGGRSADVCAGGPGTDALKGC